MNYQIEEMDDKGRLLMSLVRTNAPQTEQSLYIRNSFNQVSPPRYDSVELKYNNDFWVVPIDCKKISWSITPTIIQEADYDESQQITL